MPYCERSGVRLYYEMEGDAGAPAVTLLNGYSRSSSDFRGMSRFLSENGWRVLRLDNRGAGKTENAPGFSVSDMVADVVGLWDSLRLPRSHLLGISYGGVLSILIAHHHPERLYSLALVSTTPSSFFLGLDNRLSSQSEDAIEENLRRYFSPGFAQDHPMILRSLVKEAARVFLDPVSRERAAQQRTALNQFDFTPLLHSIRCPTVILHGVEDAVILPEAAEILHRSIKQSELELLPGVGHLLLAEVPKLFYERVLSFLNRHRSS